MYQISYMRKEQIKEANLGHKFDEELLHQCAYYPRPASFGGESPCTRCSFDNPNRKCKRAHILNDTRIGKEVWVNEPRVKKVRVSANEKLAHKLGFLCFDDLVREVKQFGRVTHV
jgi:hypothetical protein